MTTRQEIPAHGIRRDTRASLVLSRDVVSERERRSIPRLLERVRVEVFELVEPLLTSAPITNQTLRVSLSSESVESSKQIVIDEEVRLRRKRVLTVDSTTQYLRREHVTVREHGAS